MTVRQVKPSSQNWSYMWFSGLNCHILCPEVPWRALCSIRIRRCGFTSRIAEAVSPDDKVIFVWQTHWSEQQLCQTSS